MLIRREPVRTGDVFPRPIRKVVAVMELIVVLAFLLLLNVLSAAGLTADSRIVKRCDDYWR
jgi:hypothetical protein